jgi:hypothetical protein
MLRVATKQGSLLSRSEIMLVVMVDLVMFSRKCFFIRALFLPSSLNPNGSAMWSADLEVPFVYRLAFKCFVRILRT